MNAVRRAGCIRLAVVLIAFLPAVEPGESFAWSPGAPPSPVAATRAFGQLLRARYPSEYGYWICPAAQVEGNDVYCAGEVHAGSRYHSLDAAASSSHGRIVFARVTGHTWVRRWHRLDQTTLGGNGARGRAVVNSPGYDWSWIAGGAAAYSLYRDGPRSYGVWGVDGPGGEGYARFYQFRCRVAATAITCTNALGDAIRYVPPPPQAAIVFVRGGSIWTMNADGSHQRPVVRSKFDQNPKWSQDHRWIAFDGLDGVWLVRPDGSAKHRLAHVDAIDQSWSPGGDRIVTGWGGLKIVRLRGVRVTTLTKGTDESPAWSPEGDRIAFVRRYGELYVVDASGRHAHPLLKTVPPAFAGCQLGSPSWSPDEKWIVFSCVEREAVWIVAADGSRVHRLVTGSQPDWSPDGLWIVFSARPPRGRSTLYAIHPDGSGLRRLTNGRTDEEQPDW